MTPLFIQSTPNDPLFFHYCIEFYIEILNFCALRGHFEKFNKIKVHAVRYALLICLLLAAPTSTHGVFTSFSLSQYCCLQFRKNKFGSILVQGFLRVKGQAQMTKCYFLWVDAVNMQSLSGHYLMRQQAPMVFSLHLLQYCCLHFWKDKVGYMLTQGFLRVKSQVKVIKCYFLWVGAINMQSLLSGHYLMHQHVPMVFSLLLAYLGAIVYISVEISLGSCWRRDILRVKGQALFTNCNFLWLCVNMVKCNHREVTTRCAIKSPWCLHFF